MLVVVDIICLLLFCVAQYDYVQPKPQKSDHDSMGLMSTCDVFNVRKLVFQFYRPI